MSHILYNHGMTAKQNGNITVYSICMVLAANYGSKEAHQEILNDLTNEKLHLQQDYSKSLPIYLETKTYGYSAAYLGGMYSSGKGVETDIKLAKKYYKLGVEQNNLFAILGLANLYTIEKNNDKVLRMVEKAAALGHVDSLNTMGFLYDHYKGNHTGARELYEEVIKFGHPGAHRNLAHLYRDGVGVKVNIALANELDATAEKCRKDTKFFVETMYKDIVIKVNPLDRDMEKYCRVLDELEQFTIEIEI